MPQSAGAVVMSLRTVFVGACFGSGLEGEGPPESLIDYAAGLAASQEAHLSVALGVLDIVVRSAFTAGLQQLVESFNREQREKAQSFADQLTSRLNASGVVSDIEVALGPYASVAPRFVHWRGSQMSRYWSRTIRPSRFARGSWKRFSANPAVL